MLPIQAPSMRTWATRLPPSSATAMFMGCPISCAFFSAAAMTRRASARFTPAIRPPRPTNKELRCDPRPRVSAIRASAFGNLRVPSGRPEQAVKQNAEHDEGNQDIHVIVLDGEGDGRERHARHRSGNQQQQAKLNDGARV